MDNQIKNLKIRCSKLNTVMGASKCKDFDLSVGAKTYVRELVDQIIYKYKKEINSKYLDKGNMVEWEGIELYNEFFFTKHKKNEGEEQSNDWITGTCDVDNEAGDEILEFKCPWSKETFPKTAKQAKNKDYEVQTRGYMFLYKRSKSKIIHTLIDTPDSLLEWENNLTIHHVSDLPIELRLTIEEFKRDVEFEKQIKYKVGKCREYAKAYFKEINDKHNSILKIAS